MAKPKFKYNINHYLSIQPRHVTIESIVQILSEEHGISRDMFYRDRNITIDDDFSIPSDRLEVYAGLFGVTVDELKNYTTKKIKPLAERKLTKIQKTVIQKSKLVKGSAKAIVFVLLALGLSGCVSYAGVGKCPTYASVKSQNTAR